MNIGKYFVLQSLISLCFVFIFDLSIDYKLDINNYFVSLAVSIIFTVIYYLVNDNGGKKDE